MITNLTEKYRKRYENGLRLANDSQYAVKKFLNKKGMINYQEIVRCLSCYFWIELKLDNSTTSNRLKRIKLIKRWFEFSFESLKFQMSPLITIYEFIENSQKHSKNERKLGIHCYDEKNIRNHLIWYEKVQNFTMSYSRKNNKDFSKLKLKHFREEKINVSSLLQHQFIKEYIRFLNNSNSKFNFPNKFVKAIHKAYETNLSLNKLSNTSNKYSLLYIRGRIFNMTIHFSKSKRFIVKSKPISYIKIEDKKQELKSTTLIQQPLNEMIKESPVVKEGVSNQPPSSPLQKHLNRKQRRKEQNKYNFNNLTLEEQIKQTLLELEEEWV